MASACCHWPPIWQAPSAALKLISPTLRLASARMENKAKACCQRPDFSQALMIALKVMSLASTFADAMARKSPKA